jgi:hypothetical protein
MESGDIQVFLLQSNIPLQRLYRLLTVTLSVGVVYAETYLCAKFQVTPASIRSTIVERTRDKPLISRWKRVGV